MEKKQEPLPEDKQFEITYLAGHLQVSEDLIRKAVEEVGYDHAKVEQFIIDNRDKTT